MQVSYRRRDGISQVGAGLGSSSVTTDANGGPTASALYKAFGETRYTLGNLNTDYHFTGQREEVSLGIYWFQSRWYDSSLGRFTQPDTIVPTQTQGTQAWDRYAFVNNNPVRYNDPTGHQIDSKNETGGNRGSSNSNDDGDLCSEQAQGENCREVTFTKEQLEQEIIFLNDGAQTDYWLAAGLGIASLIAFGVAAAITAPIWMGLAIGVGIGLGALGLIAAADGGAQSAVAGNLGTAISSSGGTTEVAYYLDGLKPTVATRSDNTTNTFGIYTPSGIFTLFGTSFLP